MKLAVALVGALLLAALLPAVAHADEVRRDIGGYTLTLHYANEPPYLAAANTLIIQVTDRGGAPVAGLQDTLQIGGQVVLPNEGIEPRTFAVYLRPDQHQAGRYEAIFIAPYFGDYRFRIVGTIAGTPVDEIFESGEGGLPDIAVAGENYTAPGVLITLGILAVYLVAIGALAFWKLRERRRAPRAGGGLTAGA